MRQRWGAAIVAALLVASILTLAGMFLHAVDRAADHFDRAAISQAQFADVLALRAASQGGDAGAVAAALARYRADIAAESRIGADPDGQRAERADADAMAALAVGGSPDRAALSRLVALATDRERAETAEAARAMARLRVRSRLYALLLAGLALLAALVGAAGLRAANRRLERAVAGRTAQLTAVDASRRLFFAKVSHELRTPVTVMRGEADVALATAFGDPRALAAALGEVVVQSEQLDRRIAELLALAQADDGRLTLEEESVDLAALVERAVARTQRHAAAHGLRLETAARASAQVRGDARWLEQAVIAVLDNAVKFSPEGGTVALTVDVRDGIAELAVADRGTGALPETLPRLFDAYYQTGEGRARGGSGLGLALVRWVTERHGGTARAAAREGGGCVVTLALPIAR